MDAVVGAVEGGEDAAAREVWAEERLGVEERASIAPSAPRVHGTRPDTYPVDASSLTFTHRLKRASDPGAIDPVQNNYLVFV